PGDWMGILRTTDGGVTWTDVSPPSLINRTWHHAKFFLDANHAWVEEVTRTADACASQATTFITSDGGATWRQGGAVALKLSSPLDDLFNVAGPFDNMDFVDPQHGWLMVASAPNQPPADPSQMTMLTMVYSTSDGGMHWRLVSTNPGKSLQGSANCQSGFYAPVSDTTFVSDTTGWLGISCGPGPLMLITHDGGATWSPKPLPSCNCQVYRPQVIDADHVLITGGPQSQMLATADGGTTWTQRALPPAAMSAFSFIDANHGWMAGIAQLPTSYETVVYRTADGGQNWVLVAKPGFTAVSSNPKAYYPITGVQFVNANIGFVVLGGEGGTNGQTDPGAPTLQFLKTTDGGRSWAVVLKQVPVAACSAQYSQRFGGGDLNPVKLIGATTAWASGGLRTTDGGAHWKDVSSPALREGAAISLYPPSYTDFYLDGDHAWQAAVYGSKTTCSDHVTVFATADGGATWQQSAPLTVPAPSGFQIGGIRFGFSSPTAGWMWIPIIRSGGMDMGGGPATEGYIYLTADGGMSWQRTAHVTAAQFRDVAPTPSDAQNCPEGINQVAFVTPRLGWLDLNCLSAELVTRDGGATWKVQSPSFGGGTPTFVDANHGFVQSFDLKGGNTTLLSTSDGGATWQPAGALPANQYIFGISYLDANNIVALFSPPGWNKGSGGKDWVYRSTDGGKSWTLVQKGVPLGYRMYGAVFSDPNTGMVAQADNATCGITDQSCPGTGDTVVAVTKDGGRTWKIFKPAIDS
ncbi:MAG TPA: YCF48-related protein, partial [Candidatus Dormibacteraeota bacterium]|nr:YCF48-related protein [Candidatus Dormibacteraeota bacterium]